MLQAYCWQDSYQKAVLETDNSKLQTRLWLAEIDLQQRFSDGKDITQEEFVAMENAVQALAVLAQERLGKKLIV